MTFKPKWFTDPRKWAGAFEPAPVKIIDARTVGMLPRDAFKTETARRQLRALDRLKAAAR